MDFRFTTDQEAFRQEIRAFVRAALPEPPDILEDAWIVGFDRAFSKKLAARGWIGLTWPRAYGGQGKSYLDRLILTEELLRHGAPAWPDRARLSLRASLYHSGGDLGNPAQYYRDTWFRITARLRRRASGGDVRPIAPSR